MKLLNERLKNLLFLELNKEKASEIFNLKEAINYDEDIFIPVNSQFLVKNIEDSEAIRNIPVIEFIKGMSYAIGADESFRYAPLYIKMLQGYNNSKNIILKLSSDLYKDDKKIDSFILLNGIMLFAPSKEIEDTLLSLSEEIALVDREFTDNAINVSKRAIENNNINGYLFLGSLYRLKNEMDKVLFNLKQYLALGGEETIEITNEIKTLERNTAIEEAYEILKDNPSKALEILMSYYNEEKNNPRLLLNIAVANRLLKNYEKAIMYLEEAMAIDPEYLDIINELGLNYAMINDFETSIKYFKPVYEATKELAPLTNLIIALFNVGRIEEAKSLLNDAKHMDPDDEIISIIEKTYLSNEN